ncbi:MAG: hypothetical protein V3U14_12860 [candidate division NC10 bacterium]
MSNLSARRWKTWTVEAAEHTVRAFAGGALAGAAVVDGVPGLDVFLTWAPWKGGAAAAILSLLMSLAAKRTGSPNSAAFRG